MDIVAGVVVGLVAALHVYFLVLEMFFWTRPLGRRIFGLTADFAGQSAQLAANQGLLYVLAMVVIGGMVGAGSLGYIVVSGFSQDQLFGKGLAAGIAIAALGIMLDRIARYAAARYGR